MTFPFSSLEEGKVPATAVGGVISREYSLRTLHAVPAALSRITRSASFLGRDEPEFRLEPDRTRRESSTGTPVMRRRFTSTPSMNVLGQRIGRGASPVSRSRGWCRHVFRSFSSLVDRIEWCGRSSRFRCCPSVAFMELRAFDQRTDVSTFDLSDALAILLEPITGAS